jgi:hypothetical protein
LISIRQLIVNGGAIALAIRLAHRCHAAWQRSTNWNVPGRQPRYHDCIGRDGHRDDYRESERHRLLALRRDFRCFSKFLSILKPETKSKSAREVQFYDGLVFGNEKHFSKYLAHLENTPCRILEIGCYEGRATVWLLENIATHPDATIECIDVLEQASFRQNILAAQSPEKVRLEIGRSQNLLRLCSANLFDFVYVDGSHETVDVLEDAVLTIT